MKFLFLALLSISAMAAEVGKEAPAFTLQGVSGKSITLSDYRGKFVVLEWLNHGCPFVRKHYDSQNMQNLQKAYTDKGVVWLSVISSTPGKQGYVTAKEGWEEKKKNNSHATEVLLDPTGKTGKEYGAKTTPHMYVIDKEGKIIYQGAIDDRPDTEKSSIKESKNYIVEVLDATLSGKPSPISNTKAYGCSVKY